ncbi:thiosulfate sulfurtransferase GlpE [uncultured Pseudoteredinibacter sp.]|uniref:thiosulfate sulfurtransferase GlpE n=1 Tax=uncultured Pseudoteredinibacter sp. TaxID=1641701 RepID=UPI0026359DC6|nr:thiosulfate sulfurtransferase GlpE [uncultured Pseudoteredinibacter sp.]
MQFHHINCKDLAARLEESECQLVDIRDPQSFQLGHIPGSIHLSDQNLDEFLMAADPDQSTIVICYHGNSSQQAAAFLAQKDFTDVYSLDGGMEHWRSLFPQQVDQS